MKLYNSLLEAVEKGAFTFKLIESVYGPLIEVTLEHAMDEELAARPHTVRYSIHHQANILARHREDIEYVAVYCPGLDGGDIYQAMADIFGDDDTFFEGQLMELICEMYQNDDKRLVYEKV